MSQFQYTAEAVRTTQLQNHQINVNMLLKAIGGRIASILTEKKAQQKLTMYTSHDSSVIVAAGDVLAKAGFRAEWISDRDGGYNLTISWEVKNG